jgi:hypothetical protein
MNAESQFGLNSLLSVLIAALIFGCEPRGHIQLGQQQRAEPAVETTKLADGLHRYLEIKGAFPKSKEDFEAFCRQSNLPCATVDWSRVSWQSVTDKKLTIVYSSEGYSIPITVEQNSGSSWGPDTTREKLKENLQKFMEDGKSQGQSSE